MTAYSLIRGAMIDIGTLQPGEVPSAAESQDCLDRLNQWVSGLATQRQSIFYVPRVTKDLTANQASYTVGPGGDINITRPLWIDRVNLVYDTTATPNTEILLTVYSDQEWQLVAQKSLTANYPTGAYYDYSYTSGLSRIYVWPIPTTANCQLVLYPPQQVLTSFADLTTDYGFPPGYERMFRSNLAVEISPMFQVPVNPDLKRQADMSLADVKRSNQRENQLIIDNALTAPSNALYNINADTFGR